MGTLKHETGDIVTLIPGDHIDASTAGEFERALLAAVDEGSRSVVIDLSNVTYISSVGLGAFVKGAKRASERGGRIGLCGLRGEPLKVLEKTNLHLFFELFATRAEASAMLNVASKVDSTDKGGGRPPIAASSTVDSALTLPEEILLLALREEDGRFIDLPGRSLDHALAGAVLMELCLRGKIDIDLQRLVCVDPSPMEDDLLDPVLKAIAEVSAAHSAQHWIRTLVRDAPEINRRVIDRLVRRNILQQEASGLRRALRRGRHPLADQRWQREVRQRVLGVIMSGEIPLPRDIVIIALAEACTVFDALIDEAKMPEARARILEIAGMDLLALSMLEVLVGLQREGDTEPPSIEIFSRTADSHSLG